MATATGATPLQTGGPADPTWGVVFVLEDVRTVAVIDPATSVAAARSVPDSESSCRNLFQWKAVCHGIKPDGT